MAGLDTAKEALFQSTLPAGGATMYNKIDPTSVGFQSTLPAGGATRRQPLYIGPITRFQSTLPAGGATA